MFKNYLKIAFRSLWRNKAFSAINIFGLAIGIGTCLLILLFVMNEFSYDRFNKKADRIVRVVFRGSVQGEKMKEANVMPPVAQALKADYPEVLEATRLRAYGRPRFITGEKSFAEADFAFVDSNFFQVFTFPFLQGDPKTALLQTHALVISETVAKKYFGRQNPMGKMITFKGWDAPYKITGVMNDMPENAQFHFDLLGSMASFPESREQSWMTSNYFTYLVLPEGYDYKKLAAKLPQVVVKYMGPQLEKAMGISLADFRKKGNDIGLYLQPLTEVHLHSDLMFELAPTGDIQQVYIFEAIAFFMLLIACINFMNLSTAGAAKRAREVGIRKVLGSLRTELIRQFLLESLLMTIVALLLAVLMVKLSLPYFNDFAGKKLSLDFFANAWILPGLLFFGLLVGLLAGSYPAFFLSAFKPVNVLKGKFHMGRGNARLRSGLVVFQFFISTTLIVGTIVVYKQLSYIRHRDLGYDKEQVILLPPTWWLGKNAEAFRNQLLQDPRVENVSTSYYLPAGPSDYNNCMVYPDGHSTQMVKTLRYDIDERYIPTLGIRMAAGRNFSKEFSMDSTSMVINETAAKELGWGLHAVGRSLTRFNVDDHGKNIAYQIIGVVKDFNFKSLHERISPLVMILGEHAGYYIVKTKTANVSGLLATMKKNWTALTAELPFDYSFLDERFNNAYKAEQKTGLTLGLFAALTIFVASMGLFGLSMFTAEQRTREIGIRKVLGATVTGVTALLSRDFLKLVIIANIIAWPLAWWFMNKWLQDFAYRITISWWIFVAAGLSAVLIAIFTVSFQAIKAGLANPVDSLRSE
ncbi:MAG TPA: ABC transporter permease [Puia sp.]|nr:ABC transporter permease [Puia sp.]